MQTVFFGAQGIALGTYNAYKELNPEFEVKCFTVTSKAGNPPVLANIPVIELAELVFGMTQKEKDETEVIIATPESVMGDIEHSLSEAGIHKYSRMDSCRWAKLQERAFAKNGRFIPLSSFSMGKANPKLKIYKMVHHKDKQLRTQYEDPEYVTKLQVGAVFSDRFITVLRDSVGDNISSKNGNYSELSGLYWVWKNVLVSNDEGKEYIGLAHYRRFLEITEGDIKRLSNNDIDVILPYPMPYEPSIEEHHKRYLSNSEWNAVLQALEELYPDFAIASRDILKQEYLYNYNVIIAKRNVLDDYCKWLFPLLFRIEEINDPLGKKVPNRYIGYVGETLETLYFMYNKEKLRIAHTGCRFLI